ncbi:MAG TPA: PD-(D/E)XK nuclease family protein, partial [Candidatus Saccharimonadia bacterium]|nr:PD-(D/E)XK nuclease family protein [Candidatus Saccharimonadia bacterium]
TAETWPGAPAPNPLLPVRWQRERGVPRSSAARELEFAQRLTAQLSHAAPDVVFSFASRLDEHVRAASPLVAGLPRIGVACAPLAAERLFLEHVPLERVEDRLAPAVPAGSRVSGGAGLIETQSGCAFRAVARHRLRAEEWPATTLGIGPRERGMLVHAALAAFWNEVRDQAALLALSEDALDRCIAEAIERSRTSLDAVHWNAIPAPVAKTEAACLQQALRAWLAIERERAPFTVVETETQSTLAIAGFTLDVRLDRIDALATGGVAIIDYKSGQAPAAAKWFDERPQGIQLAVYARAHAQREAGPPVGALVYGRLRRGEVGAVGLAEDEASWPGVTTPAQLKGDGAPVRGWDAAMHALDSRVASLAAAIAAGEASVAPRDRAVCRTCHLQALCRIGAMPVDDDEARFEAGDDA